MSPRRPKAPLDDEDAATKIYDSAPRAAPLAELGEMTEMDAPPIRPTMPLRPAGRATPNPTEGPSVQRPRTAAPSAPQQPPTARSSAPTAPPPMPPKLPQAQQQAQPLPPAPMKSVSMKTPAEIAAEKKATRAAQPQRPQIPQVQIRSIGEVHAHRRAQTSTPAHGLGTIAPPRDPKQAREREIWSLVFWGSIVVIIASLVALVVWLIAR